MKIRVKREIPLPGILAIKPGDVHVVERTKTLPPGGGVKIFVIRKGKQEIGIYDYECEVLTEKENHEAR